MSLRTRASSFLAGFAVAGGAAFYQLHRDLTSSSEYLAAQAREAREVLEGRVAALEAIVAGMQPAVSAAVAAAKEDTPLEDAS
ncbi:hypothetical protein HT031_002551 [Scenedesmus sp. PABB004]|nr:hypothetical protein HT031_002551 [Scenedesmus sp. PABB004]